MLKADVTPSDIKRICEEAKKFGFNSVCINPCYAPLAKKHLEGSKVKITAVISYPLGQSLSEVKALEAEYCVKAGADELDMVMSIRVI